MTIHYNCSFKRAACGRTTTNQTTKKSKVTCLSCRRSWCFNKRP